YHMVDDEVLEEVTVSIRKYPIDGRKRISLVTEHRQYTRHLGKVIEAVFPSSRRTEIEKIKLRLGQTVPEVIETLDGVIAATLEEFEYGTEPPTWFAQHQWQIEVQREIQ